MGDTSPAPISSRNCHAGIQVSSSDIVAPFVAVAYEELARRPPRGQGVGRRSSSWMVHRGAGLTVVTDGPIAVGRRLRTVDPRTRSVTRRSAPNVATPTLVGDMVFTDVGLARSRGGAGS